MWRRGGSAGMDSVFASLSFLLLELVMLLGEAGVLVKTIHRPAEEDKVLQRESERGEDLIKLGFPSNITLWNCSYRFDIKQQSPSTSQVHAVVLLQIDT